MASRVETLRVQVAQHQCDHLGHINASYYMGYFADAAFSMMTRLAVPMPPATLEAARAYLTPSHD